MDRRFRGSANTYLSDDVDDPQTSSENGSDSPVSGDDSRATAATPTTTTTTTTTPAPFHPKKSRRSIKKRVVAVPIGDLDGSRSRGEAYPPSDSWTWRKYGQKPIKGSPYPRGYYRCSSSKGCPARKQVERSHVDPTMLLITYAFDHNHLLPSSSSKHRAAASSSITAAAPAASSPPTSPPSSPAPQSPASDSPSAEHDETTLDVATTTTVRVSPPSSAAAASEERERELFPDLGGEMFIGEMSWMSDVFEVGPPSSFVGPSWWCDVDDVASADVAEMMGGGGEERRMMMMREEDESLFADLDELPECSAVFRRRGGDCLGLGFDVGPSAPAAPLCGGTG